MTFDAVKIGIIGTGGMGGRHALNLALRTPGARVVGIMDVEAERAAAVAEVCDGAKIYTDADMLIADPNVDALVIASPDHTHARLASACIAAGKPVLCEKPLATSVSEAEGVVSAEVANGQRLVQLGFMREYDPAHRQIFDAVQSGRLGRPLYFRGTHTNLGGETPRTVALPNERSQCQEGNLATSEADKHKRNFDVATLVKLYTSSAATQPFRKFQISKLCF